ncbi:kinase-like domain-containing protein [Mycena floridula]|nr:kinase-like domain-containing protein [Mycena floridula]
MNRARGMALRFVSRWDYPERVDWTASSNSSFSPTVIWSITSSLVEISSTLSSRTYTAIRGLVRPRVTSSSIMQSQSEWDLVLSGQNDPYKPFRDSLNQKNNRRIGAGSFGRIMVAEDALTGKQKVALKKIAIPRRGRASRLNVHLGELEAMSRVKNNSFCAHLLGGWVHRDELVIAMPFYENGDLGDLIHLNGFLPYPLVQFYAAQLILALQFIHQSGIIHLDLKPENILLDQHGNLVVSDFGISPIFERGQESTHPYWMSDDFPCLWPTKGNSHLVSGIKGTLLYMAPEVNSDLDLSFSYGVDYWSLGIIVHKMITGFWPYDVVLSGHGIVFPNGMTLKLGRERHYFQQLNSSATKFLSEILVDVPKDRLSVAQMKRHEFLSDMDWGMIAKGRLPVPLGGIQLCRA